MSSVYGFTREAIRIKVKKYEGNLQPEYRKFSVDPQITTFEMLQSILGKAFDIKGEFTVFYRILDSNAHEIYLPLLSDYDLDAAFLKAHNISLQINTEPCLCLRVDLKLFEECSEEWETNTPNVPMITQIRNYESKPSPRLHGIINQVGRTLNMVKGAFNFSEEGPSLQPPRRPLSDTEFREFLDPVGQIVHAEKLRTVIYLGGIEPSLRKVVWKFLLNVYPDGMTGKERMDYIKRKAAEYMALKETWKKAIAQGPVVGELAYTTGMVRKDVLRTDRHHKFYAGSDDNQNIAALFNILTTYALNHPKVSYCQGMSDLASPLLVTMGDEAHAYICFCALMTRLSSNFMIDGIAMTQKFTHLAEGILYYDPEFYNYLKLQQADDLLFCYRWLLLEMKREFAFDDSLRMLEVLWSSLPPEPPEKELKLLDVQFQVPSITPPISPLVKTPRENPYTKVCAIRRQSSSISLVNYSGKKIQTVKRQNHSLDDSLCRSKSITIDSKIKHQSLDDNSIQKNIHFTSCTKNELRPRSVSPLEQKSDSVINNRINRKETNNKSSNLSSSMSSLIKITKRQGHFRELKEKLGMFASVDALEIANSIKEEAENRPIKMVKNLNEFLNFASNHRNKLIRDKEKPKIKLTKSSFDDSESSSLDRNSSKVYSSSCEDTFDECSPDDSQEYFPMTTSVTRELKIELDNLDRQVFGDKYKERLLDSPDSGSSNETKSCNQCNESKLSPKTCECTKICMDEIKVKVGEIEKTGVFIWENPLHQTINFVHTPDEQADLDFDSEAQCVDEISARKTVTPIKIIHSQSTKSITNEVVKAASTDGFKTYENGTNMVNSCEEVSEVAKNSGLLSSPKEFGGGNPFLMFLCLTVLLQHREHIIGTNMDYNEMAMHFDKMVRKHNVTKVLNQARKMYSSYLKQHSKVKLDRGRNEDC